MAEIVAKKKGRKLFGEDPEETKALAKKAAAASVLARQKKYTFKDVMNKKLSNPVRDKIAKEFIDMLTDKEVRVSERIKILEMILKLTGELADQKTTVEVNEVDNMIKLEIN